MFHSRLQVRVLCMTLVFLHTKLGKTCPYGAGLVLRRPGLQLVLQQLYSLELRSSLCIGNSWTKMVKPGLYRAAFVCRRLDLQLSFQFTPKVISRVGFRSGFCVDHSSSFTKKQSNHVFTELALYPGAQLL